MSRQKGKPMIITKELAEKTKAFIEDLVNEEGKQAQISVALSTSVSGERSYIIIWEKSRGAVI